MTGEAQDDVWPLPKFYFSVDITDVGKISFQEVTGLSTETTPIEYRTGESKQWSVIKMPGLIKTSNVTLKKGVFVGDNKFFDWFAQIQLNTVKRQSVTISLLDQTGAPTMVWKLANAWPAKITGTDLKADGNEVAIETLELAHEGLTIESQAQGGMKS